MVYGVIRAVGAMRDPVTRRLQADGSVEALALWDGRFFGRRDRRAAMRSGKPFRSCRNTKPEVPASMLRPRISIGSVGSPSPKDGTSTKA
ncbi:hypothetical protein C0214_25260 [Methylobacterium sp. DM1]|nr:hypothetical protein C0214_25260 [Methylobacterium sp. DM1]